MMMRHVDRISRLENGIREIGKTQGKTLRELVREHYPDLHISGSDETPYVDLRGITGEELEAAWKRGIRAFLQVVFPKTVDGGKHEDG